MPCPICEKRKPERLCPAKGETICAVCCGTEREVTIDCPSGCTYLLRARRQDEANHKPISWKDLPMADVRIPPDLVDDRRDLVAALSLSLLEFAQQNPAAHDSDAAEAFAALAETYRTLTSGLYYEKPPAGGLPRALYAHLAQFLENFKKESAQAAGFPAIKDTEIFQLLVFFLRFEKARSNARPRSRAFLDFLRQQFPPAAPPADAPRIVLP
jgi:hypothetical protein